MVWLTNAKTTKSVAPVAAYVGGKRLLAKRISKIISTIPHKTYAEVFVGMGGVFLRRSQAAPYEVINDISLDVSTFFRVLQRHYAAFLEMMKFQITTRAEFERLIKVNPETLTDLERAARFLYLQRTAFGGKVEGRHFGVSPTESGAFNVYKLSRLLEDVHERLAGVVIERLAWQDFIPRYDRSDVLFYLDPPYWGCENYYGKNLFERQDFEKMSKILHGIKGKFLLSINDVPEIREIFAQSTILPVTLKYSAMGKGLTKTANELLVSNQSIALEDA